MGSRGEDASWINDDLKDDGNNIFEDHNDGSEDSDNQQELEEMLYSSIHYDDSSVHVPGLQDTSTQPITISVRGTEIEKQPPKLGFPAPGLNEPVDLTQVCVSYPNNEYSSSIKRTRYYQTNSCAKAAFRPFITPSSLWVAKPLGMDAQATVQSKPSSVSAFTEKLLTRSLNERVYYPGKCDNAKEVTTINCVAAGNIALKESKQLTIVPDAIEKAVVHLDSSADVNEVSEVPSADRQTTGQVNESVPSAGLGDKTGDSGENTSPKDTCLSISSPENHSDQTANNVSFQGKKRVQASVPRSKDAKKKRREILEAESSRVVDSMLEEESRSSMDGDQVHTRASHLRHSGVKSSDGGWSVGMSWQDMSANYSFEVDSVDDESICSFQMREGPTPADSRTNTPDLRENHTCSSRSKSNEKETPESDGNSSNQPVNHKTVCKSGREADKVEDLDEDQSDTDEHSVECTRYSMKLREIGEKSDAVIEDSESEVDSVVELAVPARPTPPLVDILSDGDDEMNCAKSNIHTRDGVDTFDKDGEVDEIVVLYTKSNNERVRENHQDDDLIILDVDSSDSLSHENENRDANYSSSTKQNSPEQDECLKQSNLENGRLPHEKIIKRRTSPSFAARLSRLSSQGDPCGTFESAANKSPNPIKKKLPLWLRNPNLAFKHLDHQKILDQMSAKPHLWQLCPEDIFPARKNRQSGPKCTNCCQFGHKQAYCRKARKVIMCRMCGRPGHNEPRCPSKMCLSCGERYGIFSPSCSKCRTFRYEVCPICKWQGHSWQKCPDLWRRYHLTTNTENLVRPQGCDMKPPEELWCSNCAQRGHHSHTCIHPRWNSELILPFIVSYLTPAEEESQALRVINTASLWLLDQDAQIIQSQDGNAFLSSLADETNAILRINNDSPVTKLEIEAFPSVQYIVRYHLRQWLKEKKIIAGSGDMKTANKACREDGGAQCSSTDVKPTTDLRTPSPLPKKSMNTANKACREDGGAQCSSTDVKPTTDLRTPSLLPKKRKIGKMPTNPPDLINYVEAGLRELNQPLQFKGTLIRLKNQTRPTKSHRKRACRLMNMLLIGKLGYAGGEDHLRALKVELEKLKNHEGDPRIICQNISLHYTPIFSCELRKDVEYLVDKAIKDPKAYQVAPKLFSPFIPMEEKYVFDSFKTLIKLFLRGLGTSPKCNPSRVTLHKIMAGVNGLKQKEMQDKQKAFLDFYSELLSLSQAHTVPNLPFPSLKKRILFMKSASL